MDFQLYSGVESRPCIPSEIMGICYPEGSDEFSVEGLMGYLYASEMIGCIYFCKALDLYVRCLRTKASCVLQKDIYPVMSDYYETSGVCIDSAIRRWVRRSWKEPEMRRFFCTASHGEITVLPSNKRLLHFIARTLVFESCAVWEGPESSRPRHRRENPLQKQGSNDTGRKKAGSVRYFRCSTRRKGKQTLPFYMSDCEMRVHDGEKVSEP